MNLPDGGLPLVTRQGFRELLEKPAFASIDHDPRMYHLPAGYWVYNEMLAALQASGWTRFAPGFKAGLYGKTGCPYCLKVLGMGVGENPLYFCERGYYLEHERRMLQRFRAAGFAFGPEALSVEDTIRLLVEQGVSSQQAELRVTRHDVLALECIRGVPLATQTGRHVNYELEIMGFDEPLLAEVVVALQQLQRTLERANGQGLLHNDPMPPNLILSLNPDRELIVRLVDFELAQDLNQPSPDHVNRSVEELYVERDVPRNGQTGAYIKNLDRHLLDESIRLTREVAPIVRQVRTLTDALTGVSISVPFLGGISIDLGSLYRFLRGPR